uniref:Uncharacterized protein n=1 Tax=Schistocephalus solidus TaxID=70667 RepID=A0A0X3PK03_SCHSO
MCPPRDAQSLATVELMLMRMHLVKSMKREQGGSRPWPLLTNQSKNMPPSMYVTGYSNWERNFFEFAPIMRLVTMAAAQCSACVDGIRTQDVIVFNSAQTNQPGSKSSIKLKMRCAVKSQLNFKC